VGRAGETEAVDSENVKMTTDEKLDQILKALERLEARQVEGLQKIEETAPPVTGSFASPSEPKETL
jgi:hypothetical protein